MKQIEFKDMPWYLKTSIIISFTIGTIYILAFLIGIIIGVTE